jgi:hypothetical protein
MTTNKPVHVHLSDEQMDWCDRLAEEVVNRYVSDAEQQISEGNPLHAMPWTYKQMSEQELRWWLASRKEAAREINVETCEVGCWFADEQDPYGFENIIDKTEDTEASINRCRFVRSPESNGWIWVGDLPTEKLKALSDRGDREYRRGLQ